MSVVELNSQTFQKQIVSGITLVDFWAAWCGPCQIQLPIIHELADELTGKATIATVNVDEQAELASQFGIKSIPALLLFQDGKLIETMIGINQRNVLKSKILGLIQ